MKIITCNFRGRKHSERNEPCEDSVFYINGSEVVTVAVADGAGSKKYSHAKQGADAVTKAVCNFFEAKFDDFFDSTNELELRTVIQTICHKALKEKAAELGLDSIEPMASTLLVVSFKGNKAVSVQIGDGLIGRSFHGELEPITLPQNGEYASSTYFVNSADAYKMIQIRKLFLSGTSHIFLMTDGISDCMFNDFNGVFNNSLNMILEASEEPDGEEKVQRAVKECIVDADPMSDDCTLAVICFNEKAAPIETESYSSAEFSGVDAVENEPVSQPIEQPVVMQPEVFENSVMTPSPSPESALPAVQQTNTAKKKGSAWKIIVVAVVLAVITAVAACVIIHFKSDDNEKTTGTTVPRSSVVTSASSTASMTSADPEQEESETDVSGVSDVEEVTLNGISGNRPQDD